MAGSVGSSERANHGLQLIGNTVSCAYYVCTYVCKAEPEELHSYKDDAGLNLLVFSFNATGNLFYFSLLTYIQLNTACEILDISGSFFKVLKMQYTEERKLTNALMERQWGKERLARSSVLGSGVATN